MGKENIGNPELPEEIPSIIRDALAGFVDNLMEDLLVDEPKINVVGFLEKHISSFTPPLQNKNYMLQQLPKHIRKASGLFHIEGSGDNITCDRDSAIAMGAYLFTRTHLNLISSTILTSARVTSQALETHPFAEVFNSRLAEQVAIRAQLSAVIKQGMAQE